MKTLKDINWNQVYCFYEVARKQSMKEAGQILGVSTPTVSEQIKKLEELLGITLFRRSPRKIELTNEGASLYACSKEIFEAAGRFLDLVSPNAVGGHSVRVGVQETQCSAIAIQFLNQYWDLFAPYGTVDTVRELTFEALMEKLIQGFYDWGISFDTPRSQRFECQEVSSTELVFCCSPRLAEKFKREEDIISNIPLGRSSWDVKLNEVTDDCLRKVNVNPEEIIESDHQDFIIELAQRGRCVAILPVATVQQASWRESIHWFRLQEPLFMTLYAIWLKGNDRMISIKKLKELLNMSEPPAAMNDPDLQIKVGDVSDSVLD